MSVPRATTVPGRMADDVIRLCLRRRRSRVPWVFLVYHAREEAPGPGRLRTGAGKVRRSALVLATQERRDIEG